MFKKKITYTDFNNNERTEDFYFHMSVPEVARLEAKLGGKTIPEYAEGLKNDQDEDKMLKFIEDIILGSYGKKSADGKAFLKTPEIKQEFEYSQAYAELFEEMIMNHEVAAKFAQGIGTQTKNMGVAPKQV